MGEELLCIYFSKYFSCGDPMVGLDQTVNVLWYEGQMAGVGGHLPVPVTVRASLPRLCKLEPI